MATIFTDILAKGIRQGQVPARTTAAREWYRNQARTGRTSAEEVISGTKKSNTRATVSNESHIGQMLLFEYDAKHKDTLPYYDRFPLIFPINIVKGGFMGINMHYLPPQLRAQLMDQLYTVANNDRYDAKTRLMLSYDVLNGASKFRLFKPTIKRYLQRQVRSRFIKIASSEWDIALFLPLQKFVGASSNKVYADSRKIIRG
ncbi:MAG: hypothetical protein CBD54_002480 [Alphaproteobacteria bacterium TMED194]|nr:MAG: hypothetical protein CBD54_002480 [Alphaproteobacteria bacterium TMED194]|tara:strand:- start:1620 stop:2225 length:606 start_codon:yes stop_codon:yes gene_type:complete